ncbi:MAG: hypothetical protein IJD70_04790 [Clostridia bacterium]|nr:hypothetical protein [Clostridia bacterium]
MTNEIIHLLPSQKLKDKIREAEHVFTETELLYIISMYAPSYDKKLEMLFRFAEIASPEVADAARQFIRWYEDNLKAFLDKSDDAVYKVKIWTDTVPGRFNEDFNFICASYEAALKGIDAYYKEYADIGAEETERARYKIIKTHLFTGNESDDDGFPDYLGECWLGAGKVLLEADDNSVPYVFPDGDDAISPYDAYDIAIPDIIRNRDIVLYESGNKAKRYGVILEHKPKELSSCLFAVPLDSDYIKHHNFGEAWRDHDHPYAHDAIVVTPDELPEEIRENYFAYMKYLDEQ